MQYINEDTDHLVNKQRTKMCCKSVKNCKKKNYLKDNLLNGHTIVACIIYIHATNVHLLFYIIWTGLYCGMVCTIFNLFFI